MYIGIDLGTSSVKLLLIDDKGKIRKEVTKEYPLYYPQENWSEQNPEEWYDKTFEGLKDLVMGYENEIKAISFSGQMHGLVLLDAEDKIIRPAILWCDQRTSLECDEINSYFGKDILKLTGNVALTGFTAPKILWVKKNEPENFKKIKKILLPKDYLAFKLSGIYSTDVSDASGMLLLDVNKRKWSKKMLDFFNVKEEQLPKLFESYEVVGNLKGNLKDKLSLKNDIKIVAGGGDQAVGAIGVGAVKEGVLSVALGTSGVVFASSSKYVVDKDGRLHSFCHGNGEYHQMGVMLSAAASLKWWIEDVEKTNNYSKLLLEAEEAKFDKKLHFLPYLMGERTPHNNPFARGSLTGLNIQHKRGDITRGILEGITFGLKDILEIIKDINIDVKSVRVSGGGAKSEFWQQMIANIFEVNVDIVNSTEGPAYGAAILAMVGDGIYKDVNTACCTLIKVINSKVPNKTLEKKYREKYEIFKKLYPLLNS
ncbi:MULTISPECIES: xylulokinase [Bacteria]|uniref:xylulokinase n=1 Tax=Bacteria TaxID=2 RepID=UPI0025B9DD82|nr:xylulokinase [Cetobacterium sp.]